MKNKEKTWVTIEDDIEYYTQVHESDCRYQKFDSKKGEYVCTRCGEFCKEECSRYSGLQEFLNDYETIPIEDIEALDLRVVYGKNIDRNKDLHNEIDGEIDYISDDYVLLNYLQSEIW